MGLHLRQRNDLTVARRPSWLWSVGVYATKESFVVRSGTARLRSSGRIWDGAYGTDRPFEPLGVRREPDPPPDCGHDRGAGDSRPAALPMLTD